MAAGFGHRPQKKSPVRFKSYVKGKREKTSSSKFKAVSYRRRRGLRSRSSKVWSITRVTTTTSLPSWACGGSFRQPESVWSGPLVRLP